MLSKPISTPEQPLRAIRFINSRSRPIRLVTRPNHLTPERLERLKQPRCVAAVRNEVEIDEDVAARADAPDVFDNMLDRLLELAAGPTPRARTPVTGMRAGARRLEHRLGDVVSLVPGGHAAGTRAVRSNRDPVSLLRILDSVSPLAKSRSNSRPGKLARIRDADRVGVAVPPRPGPA